MATTYDRLKKIVVEQLGADEDEVKPEASFVDDLNADSLDLVEAVLATGRPLEVKTREPLTLKRSLVNGSQRLELAGWSAARLDWYKAQGCFTEIIRYQTRLFVPLDGAANIIARLGR